MRTLVVAMCLLPIAAAGMAFPATASSPCPSGALPVSTWQGGVVRAGESMYYKDINFVTSTLIVLTSRGGDADLFVYAATDLSSTKCDLICASEHAQATPDHCLVGSTNGTFIEVRGFHANTFVNYDLFVS